MVYDGSWWGSLWSAFESLSSSDSEMVSEFLTRSREDLNGEIAAPGLAAFSKPLGFLESSALDGLGE